MAVSPHRQASSMASWMNMYCSWSHIIEHMHIITYIHILRVVDKVEKYWEPVKELHVLLQWQHRQLWYGSEHVDTVSEWWLMGDGAMSEMKWWRRCFGLQHLRTLYSQISVTAASVRWRGSELKPALVNDSRTKTSDLMNDRMCEWKLVLLTCPALETACGKLRHLAHSKSRRKYVFKIWLPLSVLWGSLCLDVSAWLL